MAKKTKLSMIAAAIEVLKTAEEPMNCREMIKALEEQKLWSSPGGSTPEKTLSSAIQREIKEKNNSRFRKVAAGKYELTEEANND
jgi:hypothetical protein